MWGEVGESGQFEWRLKLKLEGSTRPGLEPGTWVPRFDARLGPGDYINPFNGELGGREIGTHPRAIYANPDTGLHVVHDIEGGYFRIQNPNAESVVDRYLGLNGEAIPANVPLLRPDGGFFLTGVPRAVRQALTHFWDSDV
jgi:hypothetical protein